MLIIFGDLKMSTVTAAATILEGLDEMMKKGLVFTAYELTLMARNLTSDNVSHDDVRNIIENEFITQQMSGYDRELCTLNIKIFHILENRKIEKHSDAEKRLLTLFDLHEPSIFETIEQRLDRAYDLQAEKIAYKTKHDILEESYY